MRLELIQVDEIQYEIGVVMFINWTTSSYKASLYLKCYKNGMEWNEIKAIDIYLQIRVLQQQQQRLRQLILYFFFLYHNSNFLFLLF